jgi:ribonuclease HI
LWAIAEGLRATPVGGVVHVNTDCEIAAILMQPFAVVEGMTLAHPRDVRRFRESRDEVGRLCLERSVTVHWVKGHGSDVRNRAADKLATAARRGYDELSRWQQAWSGAMRAVEASNNGSRDQVACTCGLSLG